MNLILNWEKCHFLVREGIVLGHLVSEQGIEDDKAKIEIIEKNVISYLSQISKKFLGSCQLLPPIYKGVLQYY